MPVQTLRATVRLRPTRIAFLVNPSDLASVKQVMRYNTCLWGGLYNPIIPYTDTLPTAWQKPHYSRPPGIALTKRYLPYFEPDVFVDATGRGAAHLGYDDDQIDFHQERVVPMHKLFGAYENRRPEPVFGRCIVDLYRDLFERLFQFQRRNPPTHVIAKGADKTDGTAEVIFGAFPEDERLAFIAKNYVHVTDANIVELSGSLLEELVCNRLGHPLQLTAFALEKDAYSVDDPTFFVFDPTRPEDLIDLWNLRITARDVIPVPMGWLPEAAPFIRKTIANHHRPIPGNPYGTKFHSCVEFACSIDEERSATILEE